MPRLWSALDERSEAGHDESIKANRAAEAASRASSAGAMSSKLREVERAQSNVATCQTRRADYAKQIASKTADLHRYQRQLETEEKRASDRARLEAKRFQTDLERRQRAIEESVANQTTGIARSIPDNVTYDVFISHASEDKDAFVRPFAESLREAGLRVWYDEFSLGWGGSLRRSIDRGLANSKFGVVVLSEHFFAKEWPQMELNGLVAQEMGGDTRILPIWHMITKDQVRSHSPILADRLALNTVSMGINEIVAELVKLHPPETPSEET